MIHHQRRLRFADRADAARQLAGALSRYRGTNPLVLAIPRGGVPIGRSIADALRGELDVVLVRKLGAPGNPELAIGAIDEAGTVHLSEYAQLAGADDAYVRREAAAQLDLMRARRQQYSPLRAPLDPRGRTVIVVDDGLATGATMSAALMAIRARKPQHLICAVPVAAQESLRSVAALADEIVCICAPADFYAVGQFYADFAAVEDDEVIEALAGRSVAAGPISASVRLQVAGAELAGDLDIPANATGIVVFAHGSGSSRKSSRNRFVALELNRRGLATLLFDLLTEAEDADYAARFDIGLLTQRLDAVVAWTRNDSRVAKLAVGLFGASTGAAAALAVAARQRSIVQAVVSRGGRPDLAGREALALVAAPTLLIVGGADLQVLELNRQAKAAMTARAELAIVPGATHLFEESGALERVGELAADWFQKTLRDGA